MNPQTNKTTATEQVLAAIDIEARLRLRIAQLEKQINDREYDLRLRNALYLIGELSWTSTDMDALYASVHQVIKELMYAENLYIACLQESTEKLKLVYFVDSENSQEQVAALLDSADTEQTLTSYLMQNGVPMWLDREQLRQLQSEGRFQSLKTPADSWLGVPFIFEDRTLGAIVVQSYEAEHKFSAHDQALLTFVSQQIAATIVRKRQEQEISLANKELEEKVARRTLELQDTNRILEMEIQAREKGEKLQTVLYQIAALSDKRMDIDSFYEGVHTLISQLLYAHNLYIALLDEQGEVFFPYVVDHRDDVYQTNAYLPQGLQWQLTARVLKQGVAVLINQDRASLNRPDSAQVGQAVSWLGAPLVYEQNLIGVLAVQSYSHEVHYQEDDKNLLMYVALHIGKVLRRKKLS